MDTYSDDLAELTAALELKDAIHIGHSTGGGEVARYIGRHGTSRVGKAVLIGAVPPLMLKTEANSGGLPIEVFDGFRAAYLEDRAQFYIDVASGPFYSFNRPGAKVSQGLIDNWWRQGIMGGFKAGYDCIKAFSETDFTEDLKRFDVPTLVLHGDDDQVVPIADSALLSAKLIPNAKLTVLKGLPHGMCFDTPRACERRIAGVHFVVTAKWLTELAEFVGKVRVQNKSIGVKAMNRSTFEGVGGLKIATKSWKPAANARGVMILIHGFNAHSGYMEWPAEQFAAAGLASYAFDLRGRGESEGERFYVENFSDYLADVDTLVNTARGENPGLPIYVLGHSAGGVIASSYVFEHQDEVAGLVCESFAFDVGLPHLVQLALEGIGKLLPHVHVFSLNNADFSRDPAAVERMNNDPLIHKEAQPAETAREMLLAADRLKENMPAFTAPVLIIHGTDDKATRPAGSQYFYDNVGSADKTLKLYEGHYHDLLADVDKEIVMADIQNWLDARISVENNASAAA